MSSPEENWIMFEGSFVVPASLGVGVIAGAIPVHRSYGKPMEIANESMSFRVVTAEEITIMRVKKRVTE